MIPWLQQVINRIGKNDDAAAMNTTLFAGQQKIADDIAGLPDSIPTAVPATDATANTQMRDVAGNKEDAAQTVVGTTRSLMAYVKGILNVLNGLPVVDLAVPSADSTDNADTADVVGNKTDTMVSDVTTTGSVIAYLKGVIQELDQRKVAKMVRADSSSGSYIDVVNISDKGVLTGIAQNQYVTGAGSFANIRITIDGTIIYAGPFGGGSVSGVTGVPGPLSLAMNHRFDTSLRVEMQSYSTNACSTWVSYTIDN